MSSNKTNQTLKARCWKCHEIFHLVVAPSDYRKKLRVVVKIVPYPYCEAPCELILGEDQVFNTDITRGPGEPPQTWAQASEQDRARTVHETQEPPPGATPDAGAEIEPRQS